MVLSKTASMVPPERFELPTYGFEDRRSIQLSYGGIIVAGAWDSNPSKSLESFYAEPTAIAPKTCWNSRVVPYVVWHCDTLSKAVSPPSCIQINKWYSQRELNSHFRVENPASSPLNDGSKW